MVTAIARDAETLEELVIYKSLYGNNETWARPKSIFTGTADGKPRFRLVD